MQFVSIFLIMGIMVGLLISAVLVIFANKDKHIKTEYDERQKIAKGKSYTYGFYTILISEVLVFCLSIEGYPNIHIPGAYYHMFSLFLGLTVVCVHDIWCGCYWGLNNNIKRYNGIFLFALLLNLLICIAPYLVNHEVRIRTIAGMECYDLPYANIMCSVFIIIVGIAGLIRRLTTKKEEE